MTRVMVHVFEVSDAMQLDHLDLLDPEERKQVERFIRTDDGRLFAYSRIQRRLVLSAYAGISPSQLRFTSTALGKPELEGAMPIPIKFNLSHSAGFVAIAVVPTGEAEVGIDIERQDRRATDALMQSCLSPTEYSWIKSIPDASRTVEFMRLWTCKESVMKSTGHGLRSDPRRIEMNAHSLELEAVPHELGSAEDYYLDVRAFRDSIWISTCILRSPDECIDVTLIA